MQFIEKTEISLLEKINECNNSALIIYALLMLSKFLRMMRIDRKASELWKLCAKK